MRVVAGKQAETLVHKLEKRGATDLARVEKQVRRIVESVRKQGDPALRRYAEKLDGLAPQQPLRIANDELERAWTSVSEEFRQALKTAAANIRRYCEWQRPKEWRHSTQPGIEVGQVVRPLGSAGCYVPGGRYPLPSTMLMTVIPAQVAGVQNIRVVSPRPAKETMAAAFFLEVKEFYRIGGAQAIAALAYGTKSVPRVDKIVGPGNLFVTAAKKQVAFDCSIDFLAGPTEVVIVAHRGEPLFIAADLVAQAEHDLDALAVFITISAELAHAVTRKITSSASGNKTAKSSLARNGAILVADSRQQAMEFANRIAPEHITVEEEDLAGVQNAGSIFVGDYSPQAAGDYAVGPNHVLPTGAVARFRGGLGVNDFVKTISVQQLSREGLNQIAPAVVTLAEAEGLKAHADSVRARYAHA
ncbi:MAG TPA: histidinol dehydrogenase [Candidatus Angelobacter sp.]|jgi:histidinol dehydrogenase|nr:histidinol dehydrogenase [Candidatus Angelobacter sp.]